MLTKNYRILTRHYTTYVVQRKILWWWKDEYESKNKEASYSEYDRLMKLELQRLLKVMRECIDKCLNL